MRLLQRVVAIAAVSIAAGCTAAGGGAMRPASDLPARAPAPPDGVVYVANSRAVTMYRIGETHPFKRITGITPVALAVDRSGRLYVGNIADPTSASDDTVNTYAASGTLVNRINGVTYPDRLMIGDAGGLWVSNGGGGSVSLYRPGMTVPSRTLTDGVTYPKSIAIDPLHDVWVGNTGNTTITAYKPGATAPYLTVHPGSGPIFMAFDQSGFLYVVENAYIVVYQPDGRQFSVIDVGVSLPSTLAFDHQGNLYIANWGVAHNSSITVHAPGNEKVVRTIAEGVDDPVSLAFDGADNLYVANYGNSTVTVYAPGASEPLRTIKDGISVPLAIAINP